MKIAVLGDIHGNIRALEAVLKDSKTLGAQHTIFLGDLVFMGLDPQLCFDLLMQQKPLVCIKGNTDRNLEEISTFEIKSEHDEMMLKHIKYTDLRMLPKSKKQLASFLEIKRLELEEVSLLCCHGTPYSDKQGLFKTEPFSPSLSKKLSEEHVDVILSAHTHVPADFVRDGIRFINPGAVGYSFDGDVRASYALLTIEGSTIRCAHRRIEYDIDRYKMEVEHATEGFPLFKLLLSALENGKQLS